MILNEGQPEAWRVHTETDAAPTLYAERPPAVMSSIRKKTYSLIFPLDFAGTLAARDGIKTGPSTPNGEDAYDRKLVCMVKRRLKGNKGYGVKFYYHHKCSADVREMLISPCMGAERNTNASNDNPLILWKRVKTKCK